MLITDCHAPRINKKKKVEHKRGIIVDQGLNLEEHLTGLVLIAMSYLGLGPVDGSQ